MTFGWRSTLLAIRNWNEEVPSYVLLATKIPKGKTRIPLGKIIFPKGKR